MAKKLKVIPVIDILGGKVVHAVRGKRNEYQHIKSILCDSSDPLEVAKTFKTLGFSELYIADLDAIIDCSEDFQVFKRIAYYTGIKMMVDAGITSTERANSLLGCGVSSLVIGTETLSTKSFVSDAVNTFGSNRVVISLDLLGGKVLAKPKFDGCRNPLDLLGEFRDMGVLQVIVLDLTRVGSGEGVNIDFLKRTLENPKMDIYVGGGIRNIVDLAELRNLGVQGVLVATGLHTGKISIEELQREGLL